MIYVFFFLSWLFLLLYSFISFMTFIFFVDFLFKLKTLDRIEWMQQISFLYYFAFMQLFSAFHTSFYIFLSFFLLFLFSFFYIVSVSSNSFLWIAFHLKFSTCKSKMSDVIICHVVVASHFICGINFNAKSWPMLVQDSFIQCLLNEEICCPDSVLCIHLHSLDVNKSWHKINSTWALHSFILLKKDKYGQKEMEEEDERRTERKKKQKPDIQCYLSNRIVKPLEKRKFSSSKIIYM